jgi:hypothetical protein
MRKIRTSGKTVVVGVAVGGLALMGSVAVAADDATKPPPPDAGIELALGPAATAFQTIEPCRLVDTRKDGDPLQVGPMSAGEVIAFDTAGDWGTWWFLDQGGVGCDIPTDGSAVAVELTFTAVEPSGKGYIRAWPAVLGPNAPGATVLNYTSGFNPTNSVTVATWFDAFPTTAGEIGVRNVSAVGSTTHLVIDATGYYSAP